MVLVGFTHCKQQILTGKKCQTIRKPRKRAFKIGDILNLYWKIRTKNTQHLFDAPLTKLTRIKFMDFSTELALKDGFKNLQEMRAWFLKTHGDYMDSAEYRGFDVIEWDYDQHTNMLPQELWVETSTA
jgi:hypothetical protein